MFLEGGEDPLAVHVEHTKVNGFLQQLILKATPIRYVTVITHYIKLLIPVYILVYKILHVLAQHNYCSVITEM